MELTLNSTPVVWAATSPDSGRVRPALWGSTLAELSERVAVLRSVGEGYIEAGFPDRDYSYLTLGFRAGYAVVHLFTSAEQMSLLIGDGVVAPEADVQVPIMDDLVTFTGTFVTNIDRAWTLMRAFIRTASSSQLGTWCEL